MSKVGIAASRTHLEYGTEGTIKKGKISGLFKGFSTVLCARLPKLYSERAIPGGSRAKAKQEKKIERRITFSIDKYQKISRST